MKNNKFFRTLAVALIATMTLSITTVAGTNNLGDGSGVEVDFDFDFSEPDKTELEETTYTIDLTNTIKEKKIEYNVTVEGTKTWVDNDNAEGKRPESITIHLYADSEDTGLTATASEATNWKYEFKDLDKLNEDGTVIKYSIKEDVPVGYKVSYGDCKTSTKVTKK